MGITVLYELIVIPADIYFIAQEKAVTCSSETTNGGRSFSSSGL